MDDTAAKAYSLPAEEVFKRFDTTKRGLTDEKAVSLSISYGKNELTAKKKTSFIIRLLSQLKDKMIIVLFLASAASFAASYFSGKKDADFLIIIAIVLLNAFMGAFQESKAEKAIDALKKLTSPETEVIRSGTVKRIKSEDVVPGDVVILSKGSFVPADCRIFESESLQTDESSLTGESLPVDKNAYAVYGDADSISDIHNMAWGGTAVVSGHGKAIVTATGMNGRMGKIAKMLGSENDSSTPLQKRLESISSLLGNGALVICAAIFLISVIKGLPADEMFLTSVGLAVAAIPEGLPAIVTIVLSIGVREMAKRKAVVKKLPAVETLGCTNVICSDKTGTLTQNKMTVTEIYGDEKLLLKLFVLCSNDASPTESALIKKARDCGTNDILLKKEYRRIKEIPFDSKTKRMITVHKYKEKYVSVIKGAPDVISTMCEANEKSDIIRKKTDEMAKRALRVIGFGICETNTEPKAPETLKYRFAGLAGMIDPPREEAAAAVKRCIEAGIKPVMITGDHKETAGAIAKQVGICRDGDAVYTESELRGLSEKEMEKKIVSCSVFARTTPEFKVKIVEAYQKSGMIVAMTGDGINDAPALKKSDIGCAMGKSGTDVAKEAAGIVLTDDNFSTIVEAVSKGRGIYENIKRTVHFLLSCNIGELLIMFIAILFSLPAPLTAIQLLWVNLITDSLPAIALGMEKTDDSVMKEKPVDASKPIFDAHTVREMVSEGVLIGTAALLAYIIGANTADHLTGSTMAFITLSMSQLFHAFDMQSRKAGIKIFANPYLIGAFVICTSLLLCSVLLPQFASVFKAVPLSGRQWIMVSVLSFMPVPASELYKFIFRKSMINQ